MWGSLGVVLDPPELERVPGCRQALEQMLVQAFVAQPADQALDKAVLHAACRARCSARPRRAPPATPSIACEVSSVPWSLTIMSGRPRRSAIRSSSRATRRPVSERSATSARHSRLKSSTTTRSRRRRPSLSTSAAKSRLQRWFGACGIVSGARVPSARLRPPRFLTPAAPRDRAGTAACD